MDEFHMWLIGTGITVGIFTFSVWWKSQARLDKKFDEFKISNDKSHQNIYDKIVELWKHKGDKE